jgi:hypothetical protein
MTQTKENPAARGALAGPDKMSFPGGSDNKNITPKAHVEQAQKRNPMAVFKVQRDTAMGEAAILIAIAIHYAESALLYERINDPRGFLYALDSLVAHIALAGAEGIELRRLREEFRAAEAERASLARQAEASQ